MAAHMESQQSGLFFPNQPFLDQIYLPSKDPTNAIGTSTAKQVVAAKDTNSTDPPTANDNSASAKPVVSSKELIRYQDLGLGRGVDASRPNPWLNKSSFQVRHIIEENIIGTEEGGSLHSYEREMQSSSEKHVNLTGSIAIPDSPLTLGLEGEISDSRSVTQKAVGKKIVNRTVSFIDNYEDESKPEKKLFTFAKIVSKYILDALQSKGNKVESLDEYAEDFNENKMKEIYLYSRQFVQQYRITHYVSSISLGASSYHVLSEEEYVKKIGSTGSIGLESVAKSALKAKTSKMLFKSSSVKHEIGKISAKNTTERTTYDEAVVEVKIKPVHSLIPVRHQFLRDALERALLEYINEEKKKMSAPVRISNGDRNYWKVNQDKKGKYVVDVVQDIEQASFFYIIPNDDGKTEYEFNIAWDEEDDQEKCLESVASPDTCQLRMHKLRFLEPDLNILGHNEHKMTFKKDVHSGNKLSLRKRMRGSGKKAPASIGNWLKGRDLFYIRCSSGGFRKGYITAVCRPKLDTPTEHITELKCYKSVRSHIDESISMLFQVHLFEKKMVDKKRRKMDTTFCKTRAREFTYGAEKWCDLEAHPEARAVDAVGES